MIDNPISSTEIAQILPHRFPFQLVDRIIDFDEEKSVIALKNVSVNEPYFQGHFPDNPVMPGVLILEALAQAGGYVLLRNSDFAGRFPYFAAMEKVKFRKPVTPGDQLRLEMEVIKTKKNFVKMSGKALVDGMVVAEGIFLFTLAHEPSRPQIDGTSSVHRTAILGKNVVIGPNTIIGEHVHIGDNTRIEANCFLEKWTRIGEDCNVHFGSVIGSAAQDMKYKGEKSYVEIGDRCEIREYVTINRATGKDTVTKIGSDNIFLTHVHVAHNCQLGNNIIVANMTNIAGHTIIEDKVVIGGMTGIHQFVRIGKGAMVGAYTRLPQDVPPYMLCEGNPAIIRGLNLIGLRRGGASKEAIQEIKTVYKKMYRSDLNTSQALKEVEGIELTTDESLHLQNFLQEDSDRGITKKNNQESKPQD